ncbi:MAG: ABC transporter permease subunit, partial [Candidatus Izemoplasmatales bacterium]
SAALALSLHMYPFVYYGVRNRLEILDDDVLNSAKTLGLNKFSIVFKIILPLLAPAFISTGLLVLARTMANYSVPAELLLPKGIEVLTTRIYSAQSSLALNKTAVLCLIMIFITTSIFGFSMMLEKKSTRKAISVIDSHNEPVIEFRHKPNIIISFIIFAFFVFVTLVPLGVIILASFFKRWGLKIFSSDGMGIRWDYLTLNNYSILFKDGLIWKPLMNSFIYGFVASLIASLISVLVVYMINYKKGALSKALIIVAQLPLAIPNIILAIAAMMAFRKAPFDFYGKPIIMIVTYSLLFTPVCVKQVMSVSQNLDKSVYDASRTMGVSQIAFFKDIFLKQIINGVFAGFVMTFLIAFKEIPLSLLLYTNNTKTLGVLLYIVQSNSYGLEMTSAVSVVVIIISLVLNYILSKVRNGASKI